MNRLPKWGVFLIAFAISIGLWAVLFVRVNPTNSQTKSGTLVVKNLASNLAIVDETGRRQTALPIIEGRIFAAQSAFSQLPVEGVTFYVDAAEKGAGTHELPVQLEWLPEWGYYRAEIDADKQNVTLRLEEVISKAFTPNIETTGMSSDNYYNRSVQLSDASTEVTISGPQSLVNQVQGVRLRFAYNSSQLSSNESVNVVPINAQGEQVFGVDVDPAQVAVVVQVEPKFGVRSVVVRPKLEGVVASGYEITSIVADPAIVAIQGDVQLISDTTVIDTGPISVVGASESFTRTVQLVVNNVFLVEKDNSSAQVRVEIAPIERNTRMRIALPIEVRDVPEGFVLQVNPAVYFIDIVVEPQALRRNVIGFIQAYVSVGEWDAAQPVRQVQVVLPENVRRESELIQVNLVQVAPPLPISDETAVPESTSVVAEEQTPSATTQTITPVATVLAPTATSTPTPIPTLTPTSTPDNSDT